MLYFIINEIEARIPRGDACRFDCPLWDCWGVSASSLGEQKAGVDIRNHPDDVRLDRRLTLTASYAPLPPRI